MNTNCMCRVCEATGNLVWIFRNENQEILAKLRYISASHIEINDSLPQFICNDCLFMLEPIYSFKSMYEKTRRKYKNINFKQVPSQIEYNILDTKDNINEWDRKRNDLFEEGYFSTKHREVSLSPGAEFIFANFPVEKYEIYEDIDEDSKNKNVLQHEIEIKEELEVEEELSLGSDKELEMNFEMDEKQTDDECPSGEELSHQENANQRQLVKKRCWVSPMNLDRDKNGYFETMYKKMKDLDGEDFFRHTRMSRLIYENLLIRIQTHLLKTSYRKSIDPECRLAVTLTYLSHGEDLKIIAQSFKMGLSTIRNIVVETCEILWKILGSEFVLSPHEKQYKKISKQFFNKWDVPNCIGAIDGKHINIKSSPLNNSSNSKNKNTCSIVVIASCDANYIFKEISMCICESQNDKGIFCKSELGKAILERKLPIPNYKRLPYSETFFPHFFAGTVAFPLRINLMRPYATRHKEQQKRIFNYRLSRATRTIENAFGILASRWRVLATTIGMYSENAEKVVLATIALHNFLIMTDEQGKYIPPKYTDWEDCKYNMQKGTWRNEIIPLRSIQPSCQNNATKEAFKTRDILTEYLHWEGAVKFQYDR